MKLKNLRARIGGTLAAVLVLGFGVPVSIVAASAPAHAAACDAIYDGTFSGVPKYEIPFNCTNTYVSGVHRCQAVVDDVMDNAQAVECADVYATNTSSQMSVRGVGKFYCQGKYTQCQGMNVAIDLAYTQDTTNGGYQGFVQAVRYVCNPNPGPACPAKGAENVWSGAYTLVTGQDNCVYTYSFVPQDGWNGYNNVMAVKGFGAEHEYVEEKSINAQICFDAV